ncbi:MAG: PepSY domain-containing protein [Leptothrix sp. (in: b-proteobacteria)]
MQHQKDSAQRYSLAGLASVVLALVCATPTYAQYGEAKQETQAPAKKISEDDAKAIALKYLPGKVTDIAIEKKRGRNVYVVEIMSEKSGEKDVLVDLVSGKVLGME